VRKKAGSGGSSSSDATSSRGVVDHVPFRARATLPAEGELGHSRPVGGSLRAVPYPVPGPRMAQPGPRPAHLGERPAAGRGAPSYTVHSVKTPGGLVKECVISLRRVDEGVTAAGRGRAAAAASGESSSGGGAVLDVIDLERGTDEPMDADSGDDVEEIEEDKGDAGKSSANTDDVSSRPQPWKLSGAPPKPKKTKGYVVISLSCSLVCCYVPALKCCRL
jgi:hypothetical protein